MSGATVKELFVYPIKSFRGVRVSRLSLDPLGPDFDRQFALIDEEGKVLTQRQLPELTRIGLQLDGSGIELTFDGFESIDFGLAEKTLNTYSTSLWGHTLPAFEVAPEVSEWLSEVLKKKVRLVSLSETAKREFRPEVLPGRATRFTDFGPLLVVSVASLRDLEKRTGQTLSVIRFRPNIVIDGVEPFAEDGWRNFKTGSMEFKAIKPCTRCVITTLHPLTGAGGPEPLKTLSQYRKGEKGVEFGYYYAHLNEGTVQVGDSVQITST